MTTNLDTTTARRFARGTGFTAIAIVLATVGCNNTGRSDAVGSAPAPASAVTHPASVVIQPRDGTVRLPRGAHPLARPELDQGRLDPEKRIANLSLFFSLSPEQKQDRDALYAAQLDRTSPLYHHWLTPETYRARFGARPDDIARATAWLTEQGFQVHRTGRAGDARDLLGHGRAARSRVPDRDAPLPRRGRDALRHGDRTCHACRPRAVRSRHPQHPRLRGEARRPPGDRRAAGARRDGDTEGECPGCDMWDGGNADLLGPPDWARPTTSRGFTARASAARASTGRASPSGSSARRRLPSPTSTRSARPSACRRAR